MTGFVRGRLFGLGGYRARRRDFPAAPLPFCLLLGVVVAVAVGCELDSVTLDETDDVLVSESYVLVGDGQDQVLTFLHWTTGTTPGAELSGATVRMVGENGVPLPLLLASVDECLGQGSAGSIPGACFVPSPADNPPEVDLFAPGETVRVEISLPDGRSLEGETTVPGDFAAVRCGSQDPCTLDPFTNMEISWTRAHGAWAYASATRIAGIREAMQPLGIHVNQDPLNLTGISSSESDTTIVFIDDFLLIRGVNLGQELVSALQGGLPPGPSAEISVAALDRNYVNWLRVEAFKPSARVRVPSLRGDGTGVIGSAVRRTFRVTVAPLNPPGS